MEFRQWDERGREITLDPIIEVKPLEFPRRRVESTVPAGFRVDWMSGTTEYDGQTYRFEMTAGAGVGSPYLTLKVALVHPHGHPGPADEVIAHEVADMGEVCKAWVFAVLDGDGEPD